MTAPASSQTSWVVVAKVGASVGLKGFCKLNGFSDDLESLLKKEVFIKRQGKWSGAPADKSHGGSQGGASAEHSRIGASPLLVLGEAALNQEAAPAGKWLPCPPFEISRQGGRILIRFEECSAPEATRPYVNLELAVAQDSLPPCGPDEFYWVELEGMDVINHNQFPMGRVQYVFESGASDILVVKGEREHLIPFVDPFIRSIDRAKRLIVVEWDPNF